MNSKRPSLADNLKRVARPEAVMPVSAEAPAAGAPAPNPPAPPPAPEAERSAGYFAATRVGKKKITTTVGPAAHLQFRQLVLETGKSGEVLATEALNDLFRKYGKKPIA